MDGLAYPSRSTGWRLFPFSPGWCSGFFFFFFNDTATTEIYTLSLHDALPISALRTTAADLNHWLKQAVRGTTGDRDRKSTRLNSSHSQISYAVFCLKKKKCHVEWMCTVPPITTAIFR